MDSIFSGNLGFQVGARTGIRSYQGMKRFPEKVLSLITARDTSKAKVARAINVDASQFGKWLNKGENKGPKPEQVLRIARVLKTSVEYLIDDNITIEPANEELSEGETLLLDVYKQVREMGCWPWFLQEVMTLLQQAKLEIAGKPNPGAHVSKPGSSGIDADPTKRPPNRTRRREG